MNSHTESQHGFTEAAAHQEWFCALDEHLSGLFLVASNSALANRDALVAAAGHLLQVGEALSFVSPPVGFPEPPNTAAHTAATFYAALEDQDIDSILAEIDWRDEALVASILDAAMTGHRIVVAVQAKDANEVLAHWAGRLPAKFNGLDVIGAYAGAYDAVTPAYLPH